MIGYTPRPGSKTEAAVLYLRAHGGAVVAIDLAEAIDAEHKNLPAQFKAAIEHGLIEPCDLPGGTGYRLCGADAPGTVRPAKNPSLLAGEGQGRGGEPATEIRPYLGKMPKPTRGRPKKTAAPAKPKTPAASEAATAYPIPEFLRAPAKDKLAVAGHSEQPRAMVPAPPLPNSSPTSGDGLPAFRVGEYSDGSIRLEGLDPAMVLTHNAGEGPHAVMLSPAAAAILVEFLHPIMDAKS